MRGTLVKKLFILGSLIGFLTSCEDFQGQLIVNETLVVKEKKKTVVVPEGVYSASLIIKSKRKLKLKVENGTVKQSTTIKLKKGFKLPTYDGDFEVSALALNQSFKIQGNKKTKVSRSNTVHETQHCTVRRVRTSCARECHIETITLPNGKKKKKRVCRRVCRDIVRHIPGVKDVSYHYKTVRQDLDLTLVDASSLAPIADYSGGNTSTTTVFDFVGLCRTFRGRY